MAKTSISKHHIYPIWAPVGVLAPSNPALSLWPVKTAEDSPVLGPNPFALTLAHAFISGYNRLAKPGSSPNPVDRL